MRISSRRFFMKLAVVWSASPHPEKKKKKRKKNSKLSYSNTLQPQEKASTFNNRKL
jgi:hypothetical protein